MRSSSSVFRRNEECILLASSASSEEKASCGSSSSKTSSLIAFSIPHFEHIRRFQSAAATAQGPASIAIPKASGEHLFQIHAEKNACDVYECPGEDTRRTQGKGVVIVKDRRVKRFVFNWTPTVVCCSRCGSYVAIGFRSGEVNIWERNSGKLRGSFTAHFKKVSKMTFTSDGSSLITCSEDTVVSAWSVVEALTTRGNLRGGNRGGSDTNGGTHLEPIKSWTSHQLQVTDVCCSKSAGAGADLVASCSVDRTAKVFSMTHGTGNECLATFSLPKALTAICMDGEDRCIFVGSCDGEIYEMNINGAPAVEMGGHLHDVENDDEDEEGNGKGGGGDDENTKKSSSKRRKKNESFTTYRGHDRAIVSLHCTADGYHLLSTSEDGTCRLWDRASGKCVKIVKHPRADAPIASACLAFRNHVEKVIANVGEGVRSSSQHENTTTTTADGRMSSRLSSKAVGSNAERRSDATARAPLGTFERYGSGGGGGVLLETNFGETVKHATNPHPWDGPVVTL